VLGTPLFRTERIFPATPPKVFRVYFVLQCFCVPDKCLLCAMLGSVSSVPRQEIGWEERLRSDLDVV